MRRLTLTGAITAITVGALIGAMGASPAAAQTNMRSASRRATTIVIHRANRRPAQNVTLNLKNAPVRTALMQLFLKAGRDYSLSDNIDGVVTLKLTKKPFNEALRLLAENASTPLAYNVDSGVYFVRPLRTQAVRTNQPEVAQNTQDNVDASTLPENPAQVESQEASLSPSARSYGNPFEPPPNTIATGIPTWPYPQPVAPIVTFGNPFGAQLFGGGPIFTSPVIYGTPFGAPVYSPFSGGMYAFP